MPIRWGFWKEGLILPIAGNTQWDLPRNERFLEDKDKKNHMETIYIEREKKETEIDNI